MLSTTYEGDGQHVKTTEGLREVPIHSELIRLGFLDYVAKVKQSNQDDLWPDLPTRSGKPGGYFSHWFGIYRRSLGFDKTPGFPCFRHTFRTQIAEAGIPEAVIDTLVDHEVRGSIGAKVYTHRTSRTLLQAMEVLHQPALAQALPEVYGAPKVFAVAKTL
jgi:integrase